MAVKKARWLSRSLREKFEPFNLQALTHLHGSPVFQSLVREFASSRAHSHADLKEFFEVFERGNFRELSWRSSRDDYLAPLVETLRYTRRSFWILVSFNQTAAAVRVIDMVSAILGLAEEQAMILGHDSEQTVIDKEKALRLVKVARDHFALFVLERYLRQDAGRSFFRGQSFKLLLSVVFKASSEVCFSSFDQVLDVFTSRLAPRTADAVPIVTTALWVEMRLTFLALMSVESASVPKSVKKKLGALLSVLSASGFDHELLWPREESHDGQVRLRKVRMSEYLAGVQVVMNGAHEWLCGKPMFDSNHGLVIKPCVYS